MNLIEFEIQDTVSRYLDKLGTTIQKEKEPFLREMADEFEEIVQPEIGLLYGTLIASIHTNRLYQNWGNLSEIDILYTGAKAKKSWKEFRDDKNTSKPPERDYAFYQETGIDKVAKPEDAKHQGAIKYGAMEFADLYAYEVEDWLNEILDEISE